MLYPPTAKFQYLCYCCRRQGDGKPGFDILSGEDGQQAATFHLSFYMPAIYLRPMVMQRLEHEAGGLRQHTRRDTRNRLCVSFPLLCQRREGICAVAESVQLDLHETVMLREERLFSAWRFDLSEKQSSGQLKLLCGAQALLTPRSRDRLSRLGRADKAASL
jgi:hypothetical protein